MKTKLVLLFLLFMGKALFCQFNWEVGGQTPFPLIGGEAVAYNSDIYLVGGYSDSLYDNISTIQKFSPYDWVNKFSISGAMHNSSSHFIAGLYNNNIYIFGSPYSSLDTLRWGNGFIEMIEISDTNIISTQIDSNLNFYKPFSTGLIKDSLIYLIGGNNYPDLFNNVKQPYIFEYNLNEKKITCQLDSLPGSSIIPNSQMSACIEDTIYIFGGVFNTISKAVYKYVTTTHSIEKLSIELKVPRAGGKAIKITDSSIMIIGGYDESNEALRSTEVFSLTSNGYVMETGPSLNFGRKQFMVASVGLDIYVFGGIGQYKNSIYEYERMNFGGSTAVDDNSSLPSRILLHQNYPNPFNPETKIKFEIPANSQNNQPQNVEIKIFNLLGREVRTLLNTQKAPGIYESIFNGNSEDGAPLPSGIYFYRLRINNFVQTRKMVLAK